MTITLRSIVSFLFILFIGSAFAEEVRIYKIGVDAFITKDTLIGTDKDGKPLNGIAREYDNTGAVSIEYPYKDGKVHGVFKLYDYEGKVLLSEVMFKNGLKDGFIRNYSLNGKRYLEGEYINNKEEGIFKSYFDDGTIESKILFKDGLKVWSVTYYENGSLLSKESFVNGLLEGTSVVYYENGDTIYETQYKGGKKNGLERNYGHGGKVFSEIIYKDDIAISGYCVSKDGYKIKLNNLNLVNASRPGEKIDCVE